MRRTDLVSAPPTRTDPGGVPASADVDGTPDGALLAAAATHGTPGYVYHLDRVLARVHALRSALGDRFEISFAVKSNPNQALLEALAPVVETLDASSGGEVERALAAGYPASRVTFSGPAKRPVELALAVRTGCGLIVCESHHEVEQLEALGADAGRRVPVLIRINPRRAPRKFGVNMAGKPSQFGIDEEVLDDVAASWPRWRWLDLRGFHIYSGTNSLAEDAIAENFGIFADLFARFAEAFAIAPDVLVFGSGFGIPYHADQAPLSLERLAPLLVPVVDGLRARPALRDTRFALEMGRYLVGPAGYFLTTVVNIKHSRGTDIVMCDGGFNNHLAAFGLMGTVIRRNWAIRNLTGTGRPARKYMVVGPLCTTIDTLAQDLELPEVRIGDILAVGASGAYGLTASPVGFISHPVPREILLRTGSGRVETIDVSEGGGPAGSPVRH